MSETANYIGFAVSFITIAVFGGILWVAFCVGLGVMKALESASIRIVWHKHAPTPRGKDAGTE